MIVMTTIQPIQADPLSSSTPAEVARQVIAAAMTGPRTRCPVRGEQPEIEEGRAGAQFPRHEGDPQRGRDAQQIPVHGRQAEQE
jgi:hypothetical protein